MSFEPNRFEDGKELLLAGMQEHYTPDTMSRIPEQWEKFRPYMGAVPGQVDSKTYGVCHNVSGGEFDYLTGVEVSDASRPEDLVHCRSRRSDTPFLCTTITSRQLRIRLKQ